MTTRYYRLHAHKVPGRKRDHLSLDKRTALCCDDMRNFRCNQTADERTTWREALAERGHWPLCANCLRIAQANREAIQPAD